MGQRYTIIGIRWWTPHVETIGVVAIVCFPDAWKAFIGVAPGDNEAWDAQHIAAWGAELTPEEARGFFPRFPLEKYERKEQSRIIESGGSA